MAPIPTLAELLAILQDRHLLDPSQLKEATEVLQKQCADAAALLLALKERGWLTSFQMDRLLLGRAADLELGPYRILDLIGEGGMGQVFKALHRRLRRIVALKVIRADRLSRDPEVVHRFQREAQAAAQLAHPNVVIIYDADQVDDKHFLTMEYVEGIDLAQLVKEHGPLAIADACDYIRQSAHGLQHAHERGLIHRDIKPSNLLVERNSRSPSRAGGPANRVKILDMGLARISLPNPNPTTPRTSFHTEAGVIMGTPDFIAPEQARNPRTVDHRADLYSLGCTFYFLLSGRPPFVDGGAIEKMLMHQMDEPTPIEELRPDAPPWLRAVIRKLMAKRPDDRFASAQEVIEALSATHMPDTLPAVVLPAVAPSQDPATTAVVPIAPSPRPDASGAFPTVEAPRPVLPPIAAASGPELKTGTRAPEELVKPAPDVGQAPATIEVHTPPAVAAQGTAAPQVAEPREGPLSRTPKTLVPAKDDLPTPEPKSDVTHTEEDAGASRLGDQARRIARLRGHRGWILCTGFSPDRNYLASGGVDATVHLWGFSNSVPPKQVLSQPLGREVRAVAFSPDNQVLATASGGFDGTLALWALPTSGAQPLSPMPRHNAPVEALVFTPDSNGLISAGVDRLVRIWDVSKTEAEERTVLKGHAGTVQTVAVSPDGRLIASGSQDTTVRLWSVGKLWTSELAVLPAHSGAVTNVAFSPDGRFLASASVDTTVQLWDLASGQPQPLAKLEGHQNTVRLVVFPGDGKSLLSISDRGGVLMWDLETSEITRRWPPPGMMVGCATLTHDGRYLAMGSSDGTVLVYRLYPRRKDGTDTA